MTAVGFDVVDGVDEKFAVVDELLVVGMVVHAVDVDDGDDQMKWQKPSHFLHHYH